MAFQSNGKVRDLSTPHPETRHARRQPSTGRTRRILAGAAITTAAMALGGCSLLPGSGDKYDYLSADTTPRTLTCSDPSEPWATSTVTSIDITKNDQTGMTFAVTYDDLPRLLALVGSNSAAFESARARGVRDDMLPGLLYQSLVIRLDYRKNPVDQPIRTFSEPGDYLDVELAVPKTQSGPCEFSVADVATGVLTYTNGRRTSGNTIVFDLPPEAFRDRPLQKRMLVTATTLEGSSTKAWPSPSEARLLRQDCREAPSVPSTPPAPASALATAAPSSAARTDEPGTGESVSSNDQLALLLTQRGIPTPERLISRLTDSGPIDRFCRKLETGEGMPPENTDPSKRAAWLSGGLGQAVMSVYGSDSTNVFNQATLYGILRDIAAVNCPDQIPLIPTS
ncbi:hypothetical protein [Prescottella subtropica]|uniref:hypothetical protein n=1 Tax=Prescottella subtropica TaxID=2545757 RepID=UPI0010F53892|nr:hypothetical protein [Prescottella subtropica]